MAVLPDRSTAAFRAAVCAAIAGTLLAAGCTPPTAEDKQPAGSALRAVGELTVKGRAPKTGYSREEFGNGWVDTDGNGCGTRDDILRRDLSGETFQGSGCRVTGGVLDDPYTGRRTRFVRGGRSEVDIDHVVALSDAWQKGAQRWTRKKRIRFANDPLNLLAVRAAANRAKGDGDAATWLPPNKAFRCPYVARQVAVKKKYGLWVTRAEKGAMERVLKSCPDEKLPGAGKPLPPPVGSGPETGPGGAQGGGEGNQGAGGGPSYEDCAAVRAAGKAPIHRGDPGYGRHLDRDGDGIGCEG